MDNYYFTRYINNLSPRLIVKLCNNKTSINILYVQNSSQWIIHYMLYVFICTSWWNRLIVRDEAENCDGDIRANNCTGIVDDGSKQHLGFHFASLFFLSFFLFFLFLFSEVESSVFSKLKREILARARDCKSSNFETKTRSDV